MVQQQQPFLSTNDEIANQLERILASPDFNATPQQRDLLEYVVSQTLAGNASQIKGYTVATEVFGRSSDFDQSIDPIVSIQASRLRLAIKRYYETKGKNDPVRIDIPKGSYVPIFSIKSHPEDQHIAAEQAEPVDMMQTWPTLLVKPLKNLTANPKDDYLPIGLTAELAHALSHYREIRVLEALHRDRESTPRETVCDFIVDGNVRRDSAGVRLTIRLCDTKKGIQIWSGKYKGSLEAAKMISFQEDVAAEVSIRMAGGNAAISRHLSGLSRNKVASDLTTYEAMLRYWESVTLLTSQSMTDAIRALENAVSHEPDYGQIWSMLASQYAINHWLKIVDRPTPLEKAAEFAQIGVSLDPANRRARVILAYVRLMENKLPEARHEAEKAYHLCPNSLMMLDLLGWVMALAGGWERGVDWIQKAIKLNPYYRPWVRQAVFLNRFRVGDYEKAYRESLHFKMPKLFWDPLLKAAACGHLGRIEEGQASAGALLALKPDFEQRGRILIRHYIKFDDIVERVIKGLNAVGIEVR